MHYEVVVERRALVPPPRDVRPHPAAPLRSALPRRMGRVRRGEPERSPTRSPNSAADRRDRARAGLPARARAPGNCGRCGPTCGSCTSPTRRSPGPTTSRSSRPTSAPTLCRALASGPAGFHTKRWAEAYRHSARAALGRRAAVPRAVRRQPRARRRGAGRGRGVAPRRGLPRRAPRRRRRRPARDRAHRPHRTVEEHRARFPRLRPAARSTPRSARPRRVRRDGVPVAPGPRRLPRVRERSRTGRGARERSLGDSRLAPDPARRPRRLRPFHRGHAALRRAARQRVARRTQPRRQGRARRQPSRRRAVPVPRSRRVRGAEVGGDRGAPVRHRAVRGRARRRAVDAARRTRRARATKLRAARDHCAHPPTGSPISSATRVSSASRPAGPSTTRSTTVCSSGGASADATPIRTASRSRPSASARSSSAKAGRSPQSSPANAATSKPSSSARDRDRLVDVDRRPQLDRHARRQLRQAVPSADLVRELDDLVGPLGRRAPVQGHADARLRFDELAAAGAPANSAVAAATATRYGSTRGSTE